jgi:membrane fusion protein, multidrug efflux system
VLTVNAQGIVEARPIQVGDWSAAQWIITGGLKAGDRVIVDGVVKARPGSPVKIAQAPTAGDQTDRVLPGGQPSAKSGANSEAPHEPKSK